MSTSLNEQLHHIIASMGSFMPEVVLVLGMLVVLVLDLLISDRRDMVLGALALLTLTFSSVYTTCQPEGVLFEGMLSMSSISRYWKIMIDVGAGFVVLMGFRQSVKLHKGEYYVLLLGIVLGAHLLTMSDNLLMVYLSIELISIASYALATFAFDKKSTEVGMKYLLFGAVASGLMLYGISWVYALSGGLEFVALDGVPGVMAMALVLVGLLFKVAAAPMHIWSPDVYTAAPTPVVVLFSMVPKLAGMAVLVKWASIGQDYMLLMVFIAMATLTIGNFSALWQNNIKRMLAYSSIAHTGFMLVAVVMPTALSLQSLLFYGSVYLLMNVGVFMLVYYFEVRHGLTTVEDYKGLSKNHPFLTVLMVVLMIALTGLPPTAGFTAKLFIFSSLWETYSQMQEPWLLYLFIFGLLNTVVSLFYYLKLPYYMIFRSGEVETQLAKPVFEAILVFLLTLALVLLFFKPDLLMNIVNSVSFAR